MTHARTLNGANSAFTSTVCTNALSESHGQITIEQSDGHIKTLAEIEASLISAALNRYNGHMAETARRLGIGRSTLYRKVAEYGLTM